MAPPRVVIDLSLDDSPPAVKQSPIRRRPAVVSKAVRPREPSPDVCILSDEEVAAFKPRKKRKVTPPPPPSARITRRKDEFIPLEELLDSDDSLPSLRALLSSCKTPPKNKPAKPSHSQAPNSTESSTKKTDSASRRLAPRLTGNFQSRRRLRSPSSSPLDKSSAPFLFKPDPSPFSFCGAAGPENSSSWLASIDKAGEWVGWEATPRRHIGKSTRRPSQCDEPCPSLPSSRPLKSTSASLQKSKSSKPRPTDAEREAERARKAAEKEEAKAADKARKAEERQKAKDVKNAEKEAEKTAKAREKRETTAINEANKRRTDKAISTLEMILDVPVAMTDHNLLPNIRAFAQNLSFEVSLWEAPIPNLLRWRRKSSNRFNADLKQWEPCDQSIRYEDHVLVWYSAEDFVARALAECSGSNARFADTLSGLVAKVKGACRHKKTLYVIEGLVAWQRKNRSLANKAYTAAVARQVLATQQTTADDPSAATNGTSPKKARKTAKPKKPEPTYVDDEIIEDALLELQVKHGILIHHTTDSSDSAAWIAGFTQSISTIPYSQETNPLHPPPNFALTSGLVKSGATASDTYVLLLQQIGRVAPNVAYGIEAEYENMGVLMRALQRGGPTALEDVQKVSSKFGLPGRERVGRTVSARVWTVLMGMDPGSFEV
ncbi:MAG: Alpha-1,3-mannosyltransferase-like protein [Vezdaea aestivalis]|nr:MAG: Alpha-1,3-mannosyltransferase-like protein [Vezdaea aestivalis]